jgi:hypothetical protein
MVLVRKLVGEGHGKTGGRMDTLIAALKAADGGELRNLKKFIGLRTEKTT